MAQLKQWLIPTGIEAPAVEAKVIPGRGLGLVATQKLEIGDLVARVPATSLLTVPPDRKHASVHCRLSQKLSREIDSATDEDAPLSPWIRCLPRREAVLTDFPICWPAFLQEHLPSKAIDVLAKQKRKYERDLDAHTRMSCQSTSSSGNHRAFLYSWLLVNSRSFYWDYPLTAVPRRKKQPEKKRSRGQPTQPARPTDECLALCPYVDLINHASGSHTPCEVNFNEEGYVVRAQQPYAVGDELLVSYGRHASDFLLVEYGFAPDYNDADAISLDHLLLPLLTPSARAWLEDKNLLGNCMLDGNGELCHRAQCTVLASLVPSRVLEQHVNGSIDATEDPRFATKYHATCIDIFTHGVAHAIEMSDKIREWAVQASDENESVEASKRAREVLLQRWTVILEIFKTAAEKSQSAESFEEKS